MVLEESKFTKLMRRSDLIDFFLDNLLSDYSRVELHEANPTLAPMWVDSDLEYLVKWGIVKIKRDGLDEIFGLDFNNKVTQALICLDDALDDITMEDNLNE